jgi:hypothetical protein
MGMTPEERVRLLMLDLGYQWPSYQVRKIIDAIRAAIAAERERAEQAIASVRAEYPEDSFTAGVARDVIDRVLGAVRAEGGS